MNTSKENSSIFNSSDQKDDKVNNPSQQQPVTKQSDSRETIIKNIQTIQASIAAKSYKEWTPQHSIQ